MPKIRRRVVCGLSETIATLPPQSALTSIDFPTFGRPATATKPLFMSPETGNPHPGWGPIPTALEGDRTGVRRMCLCPVRADSVKSRGRARRFRWTRSVELPRIGKQLGRRSRHDLALAVSESNALEPELVQPLAAAAARRGGDPDCLEVPGSAPLHDRPRQRRPLRADSERIRRVLDVHALEHAPVPRQHRGADQIARVRRVGALRDRCRPLVQFVAHAKSWNTASVTSAPRTPP